MKKLFNLLIVAITALCLVGCTNNTGNTDGPGNGGENTPVEYPYMDYFENTVYAMKYGGKLGGNQPVHGTFRNDLFAAVGQSTMNDVTAETPYSFNDKDYGGLCFTAKTGIEVESVTFTIVAEKECYLGVYFYGPKIDENGNPVDHIIKGSASVSSTAQFKNSNFTTADGSKLIKLTPNNPLTFTIDTLRETGEVANKNETEDWGKITDSFASKSEEYRRFLISFQPFNINNGYLGDSYYPNDFESADLGVRIYNVSFDVKKI